MEQIECSETSAYIIETPGNYPKENILYGENCLPEDWKSYFNIFAYNFCANVGRILCSLVLMRLQTQFLFKKKFTLHRDSPQIATEPNTTVSLLFFLTLSLSLSLSLSLVLAVGGAFVRPVGPYV